MKGFWLKPIRTILVVSGAAMLPGCQGILSGLYDEPAFDEGIQRNDQLYVDASEWDKWHYIDISDPNQKWQTYQIPVSGREVESSSPQFEEPGIYTYWYDIFGAGISNHEFRGFVSTAAQPEPENWTFAVHRNNVRTHGCGAYETDYVSISELPKGKEWLKKLEFTEDSWNQTDVWTVQDRMLSGIIGNQGIHVNDVLSQWLKMDIPPMPPSFSLNRHVFILKLPDGSFAALQLADYMGSMGQKCFLTINYKYPL